MKIPTTLKHKPVIVTEEYEKIDGRLTEGTDAKGLSLGLAQWNDRGNVNISAKIWRYTGKKWSRQSEEMPLHRAIDIAILICRTRLFFAERYKEKADKYLSRPQIDRIGLQGGALNVAVCVENEHIKEDVQLFDECLHKDDELLSERLKVLAGILKKLEY